MHLFSNEPEQNSVRRCVRSKHPPEFRLPCQYGIDLVNDEEAVKLRFDKGLGEGWKEDVRTTDAQGMDYATAWAYYRKRARQDKALPGAL